MPPKKGKVKLPLFCGNGERVILIYVWWIRDSPRTLLGEKVEICFWEQQEPLNSDSLGNNPPGLRKSM